MEAITQTAAEFPLYLQVAIGIWIVLLILSALAFLTCFGLYLSEGDDRMGYMAVSMFASFVWSVIGAGVTYLAGAFI